MFNFNSLVCAASIATPTPINSDMPGFLPEDFNKDYSRYGKKDFGWSWKKDGLEAFAEIYRVLYTDTLPRQVEVDLEITRGVRSWFAINIDPLLKKNWKLPPQQEQELEFVY